MKNSDSIIKISDAIVKAQGQIKTVVKDSENTFFQKPDGKKALYASLDSIIEAIKEPLLNNNLAVIQTPLKTVDGLFVLTKVLHSSGEFFETMTPLFVNKNDMQGFGSAITYGKRYAIGSFFNIATESDDDANDATGKNNIPQETKQKTEAKKEAQQPAPETDYTKYKMKIKTKNPDDIGKSLAEIGGDKINQIYDFIEKKKVKSANDAEFLICSYKFLQSIGIYPPELNQTEQVPI